MDHESSDYTVTRRAPSATSTVAKSLSWLLLQCASTRHPFYMNDINDATVLPQYKQDTMSYDKVTTVSCQPTEDQVAMYISNKLLSLPNKSEKNRLNWTIL